MYKYFWAIIIPVCLSMSAFSQSSQYFNDRDAVFREAMDYFQNEKYSTAQQLFEQAINGYDDNNELKSLAQYYRAQCAIRLFNADAEYLTMQYIQNNPDGEKVNEAWFNLGGYFYSLKKWRDCIDTYDHVDTYKLTDEQTAELFFKKGYSQFSKKDYDAAKISFYEIIDKDTKYTGPANYYYGHIHYNEENYQTSLNSFLKITNDETFGPIAPYYIVQIYYMQRKYEEIVDFTPGIINNVTEKRLAEVARITGEAFFKLEQYDSSIVYFNLYVSATSSVADEAAYQLGYAYFKTDKFSEAIPYFEQVSVKDNAIGQNASYYLAACYLKKDDKVNARKAFASAMRKDFDPVIKQDAMFNYALMTFEVGGDPFNDAVGAFEAFIEEYPESKRIDEARRYLIQAYLGARNYKQALASIEKVEDKNDELKEAYQRIAYNRGIELYNIQHYYDAAKMFEKAVVYTGFDSQREAKAYYWMGESYYQAGRYAEAEKAYKKYKAMPVAYSVDENKFANYNLAYTYYKQNKYSQAAGLFRQFASDGNGIVDNGYIADSYLRVADCEFMQKSFFQAIDFYQRALDANTSFADYALMQKGICLGLAKKELDKIATLRKLIKDHPGSVYADDAYYEIAQEYLKLQDQTQAIESLEALCSAYPQSEFTSKSLVQLGLLYYNMDSNEKAISSYKKAVRNFNGTEDARSALLGLKNIYVDLGRIDEYSTFVDGLEGNVPRLSIEEKDSLTYLTAEKFYMTAQCDKAIPAFEKYLSGFPNGAYAIKANFYCGDCYYQSQEYDKALQKFIYVIDRGSNQFTEQALLGAGRITISREKYEEAIPYYSKLAVISSSDANLKEAQFALLRSYYKLNNYEEALKAANEVLKFANLSAEEKREAGFIKARSLQQTGRDALALEAYQEIATEVLSYQGAEAKYRVIELLYKQGNPDEAEKEILAFSSQSTSHEYWVGRSFILWADIFSDRENYFQAIETLQSIINYYEDPDDGILEMAKAKKQEIEEKKSLAEGAGAEEDLEVNIESKKN